VLVALLLSLSVGVRVLYDEKLFLWVRVGPVKIQLIPKKEKQAGRGRIKEKKPSEKKKAKPKKKYGAEDIKTLIFDILPPAKRALAKAAGGLRIDYLRLCLAVGGETPAKAAERYGKANALVWTIVPIVENAARIKKRDIDISLDCGAQGTKAAGEIVLHIRMYTGFSVMAAAGIPILKVVFKFLKSGKIVEEKKEKNEDKAA